MLIVDDEPMVLASLELLLEATCRVVKADSAQQAKKMLERESFAVIIADAKMPKESGVQLFEWCCAHCPEAIR